MEKCYREEGWEAYVDAVLSQYGSDADAVPGEGATAGRCPPLSLGVSDVLMLGEVLASLRSPAPCRTRTASSTAAATSLARPPPRSPTRSSAVIRSNSRGAEPVALGECDGEGGGEGSDWLVVQATPNSSASNTPTLHPHTARHTPLSSPVPAIGTAAGE